MGEIKWGPKAQEVKEDKVDRDVLKKAIKFVQGEEKTLELARIQLTNLAPPEEKFLIHRSAILTYKACPYKAYLEYFYNGHGVSQFAMPQHLLIGICIHRGLQHLLEHCRVDHPNGDFTDKCINDSIMYAHEVFSDVISKREIELKKKWVNNGWEVEDLNYTVKEIHALIEALLRAYATYRLKNFLEEYEVLEVEKEEVFDSFSEIVTWLGKSDAIVRRRKDNELIIVSHKTAAEFGNSNIFNIMIDMQGCSEIVAVEERYNRLYKEYYDLYVRGSLQIFQEKYNLSDGLMNYFNWKLRETIGFKEIKVFANQYEFLIKGKHRADSTSPTYYKYQTHLLHPIKSDSAAVAQLGSGLRFGNSGSVDYEWVIPTGKLPKGKKKIDIYDRNEIGIKNWIEMLAKGLVQPEAGDAFQDVIIAGEERLAARSREQLQEWRISTQFEAEEIAGRVQFLQGLRSKSSNSEYQKHAKGIESYTDYLESLENLFQEKLLQWFRRDGKDSQLCYSYYGGKCPFTDHCHKGLTIKDGLESGLYQIRHPHHELERQKFVAKGWIKDED